VRIGRNFSAGLANSVWSAIVGLSVVPFYLKYLGSEAFGLIGFYVTMQALMQLLDLGLSPTMNREVARASANGTMGEARDLLHSLAMVYWLTAAIIAAAVFLLSPYIAEFWLNAKNLPNETIHQSVIFMGLVIASRWPVGLYAGALMGAQRLTVSSLVNIANVTLSSIGAVSILAFVSPTIEAFFEWQLFVACLYVLTMRWAAWHVLHKPQAPRFTFRLLRKIWKFSLGMSGVAISGVLLIQADKIMLSKMVSLEEYGYYILATTLASGVYVLLTPLFNTIYPHMSSLVSEGETEKLVAFYKSGTKLFLSFLFPISTFIAVFSNPIVTIWTQNDAITSQVSPLVSIIITGTALNGVMHFPYALQLAYGRPQIAFKIILILLMLFIPTLLVLISIFGVIGGAYSWLIMNLSYVAIGTNMTHRSILRNLGTNWLLNDVGKPLLLALLVIGLTGSVILAYHLSPLIECILGSLLMLIAIFLSLASTFNMRRFATDIRSIFSVNASF
jgi:O-antigen/teichoic acid export membrane protein